MDSVGYCAQERITIPSITLGDTSGLSLTWFNSQFDSISNKTSLSTDTINSSGSYFLHATNTNGCMDITEINIEIIDPPVIKCSSVEDVACNGDSSGHIEVISELLPIDSYNIEWSDGNINSARDNLSAGIYTVSVTNSIGCQSSCSIAVSYTHLTLPTKA